MDYGCYMAMRNVRAYDEFVDFITSSPTLKQIAEFRFSDVTQARICAYEKLDAGDVLMRANTNVIN